MMRFAFIFLLPIALFGLAACGFHPVYGVNKYTHTGAEEILEQIDISNIPDREGQFLRNTLITRFYRNGRPTNPEYRLDIAPIREILSDLDITREADTTRGQLRQSTQIQLIRLSDREVVLERNILAVTSYNILDSEFTNRVSEQNTRENALNELARQIEQHVTLYLKRAQ